MKQGISLILFSTGLVFCVGLGGTAESGQMLSLPAINDAPRTSATAGREAFLLAQSRERAPAETPADKPPRQKKTGKPRPASKHVEPKQTRKKSNKQSPPAAPIKPFNPSEKIDADQAVDFPYDI